jgi:class 3 adenylate cyclase
MKDKKSFFSDDRYVGYFITENGCENIVYLKNCPPLNETDLDLIRIFLSNVAIAFDNIYYKINLEKKVDERTHDLKEEKDKVVNAQKVLSKYVPLQICEKILAGKIHDIWEHSRKRLSIFFSDIKEFTKLTETMEPEDVARLLNEYFSEMCEIAHRYGGVVSDMVGDGMFIFFGAPESTNDKDHALKCVNMAIDMQKRMKELQDQWFNEGIEQPLQIRCGINTGMVNVGGFGSNIRRKYAAMGLQVNLASRLEGACVPGKILISHSTWGLVKDEIECAPKGIINVEGFSHPIRVYDVNFK